jgi:hypothetical protein
LITELPDLGILAGIPDLAGAGEPRLVFSEVNYERPFLWKFPKTEEEENAMSDEPEVLPYVKGALRLEGSLPASWARVLDCYRIEWTFDMDGFRGAPEKGRPSFRLTEMNMVLELYVFSPSPKDDLFPAEVSDPVIIRGYEHGEFRIRSTSSRNPLDLLMYCPVCSRFFFAGSLDTPCGFCGAPEPHVQENSQLSRFTDPETPPSLRDLRPWLTQNLQELADRKRNLIAPFLRPTGNDLFDQEEAEKAKARESSSWEILLKDLSGPAFVHRWPQASLIEELSAAYPNFCEVCHFIIRQIRLSEHQPSQAVQLPNLLLVGGPSCGKSSFAEQLARILVDTDISRIDLGQAATNFALVGSDSGFKHGKEGRILRLMAGDSRNKPVRNPMVILDELDKALRDSTFDPLPALLSLLEKRDATRFVDEFFVVPVDASGINFLALANTLQGISSPLLSRFMVFQIPDYFRDQFVDVVIPAIYRDWCSRFFPGTFPPVLSAATRNDIAEAAGGIPRQVATVLDQLVFSDHPELTPSPTWESLRNHNRVEYPIQRNKTHEEGVNHD